MQCIGLRGSADDPGQHGGLGKCQIADGFVEIGKRCSPDADSTAAKVHIVQIARQNLVL